MTRFLDGPAAGKPLMLKRAPVFLRAVINRTGRIDALDQPGDTPTPEEAVYAYRIEGEAGTCHIHASGGRGGFYAFANYRLIEPQPDQETLRDSEKWRRWCHSRFIESTPTP